MRRMLMMLILGLIAGGAGVYLLGFTDYVDNAGFSGIVVTVGLLTTSLFLVVPAKIYIILRFTRPTRAGIANRSVTHKKKDR